MSAIPFDIMLRWHIAGYRSLIPARGELIDPARIVLEHFQRGDHELAQGEMFQFGFFVKYLSDVNRARPDIFQELKERMYHCAQADNYFGLRMEARIASSLARAQVPFTIQERPDFSIRGGELFVECGSVWPDTSNPDRDYRERVRSTFRKKGQSRYATPDTLLALEFTSVMAAMVTHRRFDDRSDFQLFLADLSSESRFGALLLFYTKYVPDTSRVESAYNRFDTANISPTLHAFLEDRYPRLGLTSTMPFIPGQRTRQP